MGMQSLSSLEFANTMFIPQYNKVPMTVWRDSRIPDVILYFNPRTPCQCALLIPFLVQIS